MPKYFRITAVLHEDEFAFVKRVSKAFGCSIAKALSVCVVWARQNRSLQELLKKIEEEMQGTGSKEEEKSGVATGE